MRKIDTPRVTLNSLVQYMGARSREQRDILHQHKYPKDFMARYYKEATECIATCIASNLTDQSALERTLNTLRKKPTEKRGTAQRIKLNINAIKSFQAMQDQIDFLNATPELAPFNAADKLTFHGVIISVRPEIILRGIDKSGKKLLGAIKINCAGKNKITDDSAGYISTILQIYCSSYFPDWKTYPSYCMVIDVGSKKVYPGIKAIAKRTKDISAACQNIADLWGAITQ